MGVTTVISVVDVKFLGDEGMVVAGVILEGLLGLSMRDGREGKEW